MPVLEGEAAKKFIRQDKKPLSREQKEYLEKCREVYKRHPIK